MTLVSFKPELPVGPRVFGAVTDPLDEVGGLESVEHAENGRSRQACGFNELAGANPACLSDGANEVSRTRGKTGFQNPIDSGGEKSDSDAP